MKATDAAFIKWARETYPVLWHSSGQDIAIGDQLCWVPGASTTDTGYDEVGQVVFATHNPLTRDLYALTANNNENNDTCAYMWRTAMPLGQGRFVFLCEKMRDFCYEYEFPSSLFTPSVNWQLPTTLSGEWISDGPVTVVSKKRYTQQEILDRTPAGVYLVNNVDTLKRVMDECLNNRQKNEELRNNPIKLLDILKEQETQQVVRCVKPLNYDGKELPDCVKMAKAKEVKYSWDR